MAPNSYAANRIELSHSLPKLSFPSEFHPAQVGDFFSGLLGKKIVGIEKQHLMALYYEELQRELPQARLLAADGFFEEVRMIKTPLEIEAIKQAGIATEKAIFGAFATAKPGDRERDLAFSIRSNLLTQV